MNKNIFLSQDRETSVNIDNTNTNTYTKHLHSTTNTTFALNETRKELDKQTSSVPLAPPSESNGSAKLSKKEQAAQKFKEEKNEMRAKRQAILDAQAKALLKRTEDVYRIEVTTKKQEKATQIKMNVDILTDAGNKFQRYTATMQDQRPRDITANIPDKHANWYGYEEAKQAIKDGHFAGKLKIRQTSGKQTRISPKVVPKTVAMLISEGNRLIVRLIINDQDYAIALGHYISTDCPESMDYFQFKGIHQIEEEVLDVD
jgi:hypothetical protein